MNTRGYTRSYGIFFFAAILLFASFSSSANAACCMARLNDQSIQCIPLESGESCSQPMETRVMRSLPENLRNSYQGTTWSEISQDECWPVSEQSQHPRARCTRIGQTAQSPSPQTTTNQDTVRPFKSITPQLGVPIPGLTFKDAYEDSNEVVIPFLAQYLAAAYRYMIGLSFVTALVMVIFGGFRYLFGAAIKDIERGKQIIRDAVFGMMLVLGAYTILQLVNPALVRTDALRVQKILMEEVEFAQSTTRENTASGIDPCNPDLNTQSSSSNQSSGGSTGGITVTTFNYKPDRQTNNGRPGNWGFAENQAQLIYPTRLLQRARGERVQVRAYIFLHGWNSPQISGDRAVAKNSNQTNYTQLLKQALQEVANSKDIVIMAPHFLAGRSHCNGTSANQRDPRLCNTPCENDTNPATCPAARAYPFMKDFNLANFYTAALTALRARGSFTVRDVVVGGHSMATCESNILAQAKNFRPAEGSLYGIVAYDGCAGTEGSRDWFTPADSSVRLYISSSQSGMGRSHMSDIRRVWEMGSSPIVCPPSAASLGVTVQCYRNPSREWWSFEMNTDHDNNVLYTTRLAFKAFYAPNPGSSEIAPSTSGGSTSAQSSSGDCQRNASSQSNVGAHTATFQNCPIPNLPQGHIDNPPNCGHPGQPTCIDHALRPREDPRVRAFEQGLSSVVRASDPRQKIVAVADAVAKCGLHLGSCGDTVGNIWRMAGVTHGPNPFESSALVRQGIQLSCQARCGSPSPECLDDREAAIQRIRDIVRADQDARANQLQPGDWFWVYNANPSCGGNHSMVFLGWDGSYAQVVHGAWGKLVTAGRACLKTSCPGGRFQPINRIKRAREVQ